MNTIFLPTGECEKITGIKSRKIAELCNGRHIDCYKKSNKYMVNIESLKQWQEAHIHYIPRPKFLGNPSLVFGDLSLDFSTCFKPILSENKNDEIFDLKRNEFKLQYWITNSGQIYDSDTGVYLTPDIKSTYYYVNLKRSGTKYEHFYIHYGVAYYFCKGWKRPGVEEIHHIDGKPLNNDYRNLVWVTLSEHRELHRLMKLDKKSYRKRLREIQKENSKW